MIKLIGDTISKKDMDKLAEWIKTYPHLTKGELTEKFEQVWSNWLGSGMKYSVFVNSGSSANLLLAAALMVYNGAKIKDMGIVVPSVSWATTITPWIYLNYECYMCDCDKDTLSIDLEHFEKICKENKPKYLCLVHILASPGKMVEISRLCKKYDVTLIEDACESIGSSLYGIKTGCFGLASTFSFYIGHTMSTIEGGMISTGNKKLYNILKSLRSHGWSRDLDLKERNRLKIENNIDDFQELYEFYYMGFNLRSTDLNAFIGLEQMKKLDSYCEKRNKNLLLYDKWIKNDYWKLNIKREECYMANFAYPIITPKRKELVKILQENDIEVRPLVAGNIGLQTFWKNIYCEEHFPFADIVHENGLYVPNHQDLKKEEIKFICDLVNKVINE